MKIYTKTGDKGSTGLVDGKRVSKSDPRLDAYGTVDELNSALGCARSTNENKFVADLLQTFQHDLFDVGCRLACIDEKMLAKLPLIKNESITHMEQSIDKMTSELEPLKNFILPGGHPAAAQLHLARTVCRRAERLIVGLKESGAEVEDSIIIYLNRLSDCLFTMARYVNHKAGLSDILWKP